MKRSQLNETKLFAVATMRDVLKRDSKSDIEQKWDNIQLDFFRRLRRTATKYILIDKGLDVTHRYTTDILSLQELTEWYAEYAETKGMSLKERWDRIKSEAV